MYFFIYIYVYIHTYSFIYHWLHDWHHLVKCLIIIYQYKINWNIYQVEFFSSDLIFFFPFILFLFFFISSYFHSLFLYKDISSLMGYVVGHWNFADDRRGKNRVIVVWMYLLFPLAMRKSSLRTWRQRRKSIYKSMNIHLTFFFFLLSLHT